MNRKDVAVRWGALFVGVSALGLVFTTPGAAAKPAATDAATPPSEYALAEVVFEYQSSNLRNDGTTIRIAGDGKGVRAEHNPLRDDHVWEFTVDPKEVFQLLDLCYRGHFFELNASYDRPEQLVQLGPSGRIQVSTTIVSGSSAEMVTLRIGKYWKSVSYQPDGVPPPLVLGLARRIHELAMAAAVK